MNFLSFFWIPPKGTRYFLIFILKNENVRFIDLSSSSNKKVIIHDLD